MSPSGNQVDGFPLALSKDAVPASWLRSGRAAKHKIYKQMYTVDKSLNAESIANHQKAASYRNKASVEGIQK